MAYKGILTIWLVFSSLGPVRPFGDNDVRTYAVKNAFDCYQQRDRLIAKGYKAECFKGDTAPKEPLESHP